MVLTKVARRYEQRGMLSGVIKVGSSLSHQELQQLHNYFGIDPIQINTKNEVRVNFDTLLKNIQEAEWVEKIGACLGRRLKPADKLEIKDATKKLLARLQLAFPGLEKLTKQLAESPEDIERIAANTSEKEATGLCFQATNALNYLLKNNDPITISELGARFFSDSKKLRQGEFRNVLLRWLNVYCPDLDISDNEEQIWATYHVYHDRITVNAVIYGPIVYTKNGEEFDWIHKLYELGEPATISWANLQNIETIQWKGREANPPALICCENEAPFSQLIRQKSGDAVLFSSGFPGSGVQKIYELLAPHASACYHWGDTDPNGFRIASILHLIHPLTLYRCGIETLHRHKTHLRPLSQKQKSSAEAILSSQTQFPFKDELTFTLKHGWMEQESWGPES